MYKITDHFNLEEFYESDTAKSNFIDNYPTQEAMSNIRKLVLEVLEPIRVKYALPITVTSGYRSKRLNDKLHGAINSDHLYGCAADIKADKMLLLWTTINKMSNSNLISCRQIIDEYHLKWIHISINNSHNSNKHNQILHIH